MTRLVIALRQDLPLGQAMNACGHLALGMGTLFDGERLAVRDFRVKGSTGPIATLSDHPLIVLQVQSEAAVRSLYRNACAEPRIVARVFSDLFFLGSVATQEEQVGLATLDSLPCAGVALFGDKSVLARITSRLSLYGAAIP